MTETDPWSQSLCLLPCQLVEPVPPGGGGAPLYLLPVHLHLPAAPQGRSGWLVVVVDHTADIVQPLLGSCDGGRGTGVVDVPLAFPGPEVTVKPELIARAVGLKRTP